MEMEGALVMEKGDLDREHLPPADMLRMGRCVRGLAGPCL